MLALAWLLSVAIAFSAGFGACAVTLRNPPANPKE